MSLSVCIPSIHGAGFFGTIGAEQDTAYFKQVSVQSRAFPFLEGHASQLPIKSLGGRTATVQAAFSEVFVSQHEVHREVERGIRGSAVDVVCASLTSKLLSVSLFVCGTCRGA